MPLPVQDQAPDPFPTDMGQVVASRPHPNPHPPPASRSPQLLQPPQLRKAASVREAAAPHDPAALAKRRSRLHELRAASSSGAGSSASGSGSGSEAAAAFGKRESKRDKSRKGGAGGGASDSPAMRKSHSLDAAESYSLASIQAPLWVTLTNARTIEELAQQKL